MESNHYEQFSSYRLEEQSKQRAALEQECVSLRSQWEESCKNLQLEIDKWKKAYEVFAPNTHDFLCDKN